MTDAITISMEELRLAIGVLLDEAERRFGSTVDLDADIYWDIDARVAFDPYADAAGAISAGQLSDDVASVRQILQGEPDAEIHLWHDLGHLVPILRRLAVLDLP